MHRATARDTDTSRAAAIARDTDVRGEKEEAAETRRDRDRYEKSEC